MKKNLKTASYLLQIANIRLKLELILNFIS